MDQNNQDNQNTELEVNRKNREDYEQLMKESSTNLDGFWDSNNIFVKLILNGLSQFELILDWNSIFF